jgi:hypothetical protein
MKSHPIDARRATRRRTRASCPEKRKKIPRACRSGFFLVHKERRDDVGDDARRVVDGGARARARRRREKLLAQKSRRKCVTVASTASKNATSPRRDVARVAARATNQGLAHRLESHSVPRTARDPATHSPPLLEIDIRSASPRHMARRKRPPRRAIRAAPSAPRALNSLRVHLVGRVRKRGLAVVERAPARSKGEKRTVSDSLFVSVAFFLRH